MRELWSLEKGPVLILGLLLLVTAGILLGSSGSPFAGAPRTLDLLPILAGLAFIVIALVPVLRPADRRAALPSVEASRSPGPSPPESPSAPEPASPPVWDESGLVGDSLAVLPLTPAFAASARARDRHRATIPSAWAFAAEDVDPFPPGWPPVAPPSGAALPFYPAVAQAPFVPQGLDPQSEIDRLRARVRELESPSEPPSSKRSDDRIDLSFPALTQARAIPEPPALRQRIGAATGCAGCGSLLSETPASPLCWGCGRSLCASCYWHYGPGPGLHRCPACYGQSGTMATAARSGARAGLPPVIGAGATASGGSPAVAPTAGR